MSNVLYIDPQRQAIPHVERMCNRVGQHQIVTEFDPHPRIARLPCPAGLESCVDFDCAFQQESEAIEAR